MKLVTFRVGSSRYALPVDLVTEVVESASVEPPPIASERLVGIARVRGRWIPVVRIEDDRGASADRGLSREEKTLVIVGRSNGRLGLQVEDLGEVSDDDVEGSGERPGAGAESEHLLELDGELVKRLDPAALIDSAEALLEYGGYDMTQKAVTDERAIVTFEIGTDEFGVDVMKVTQVLHVPQIRRVPNTPEFVEGLAETRDGVVPVIDMRKRFAVEVKDGGKTDRMLVVAIEEQRVGLIVDSVPGVIEVDEEDVSPPPEFFKGLAGRYLAGTAKSGERFLVLLDVDEILSSQERIELNAVLKSGSRKSPGVSKSRSAGKAKRAKKKSRSQE